MHPGALAVVLVVSAFAFSLRLTGGGGGARTGHKPKPPTTLPKGPAPPPPPTARREADVICELLDQLGRQNVTESNHKQEFPLGSQVRHKTDGYTGKVVGFGIYLHGAPVYYVAALDSTGRPMSDWIVADWLEAA